MARLPYVDPAKASEEVRSILERLPAKLNIFRMMAHADTSFRPLIGLGSSILGRQKLSPKLRELTILSVAQFSPARYEWVQHVPIARATGITDEQIAALEQNRVDAACFAPEERLMLRLTSELVHDVRPSDPVFAELTERFSTQEIVELILTVGYYMMLARLMETSAIDIDGPAGTTIVDAAR